jgi:hypothetical protein
MLKSKKKSHMSTSVSERVQTRECRPANARRQRIPLCAPPPLAGPRLSLSSPFEIISGAQGKARAVSRLLELGADDAVADEVRAAV